MHTSCGGLLPQPDVGGFSVEGLHVCFRHAALTLHLREGVSGLGCNISAALQTAPIERGCAGRIGRNPFAVAQQRRCAEPAVLVVLVFEIPFQSFPGVGLRAAPVVIHGGNPIDTLLIRGRFGAGRFIQHSAQCLSVLAVHGVCRCTVLFHKLRNTIGETGGGIGFLGL